MDGGDAGDRRGLESPLHFREGIYNRSQLPELASLIPDGTESYHSLFSLEDMTSSRRESGTEGAAAPTGGPQLRSEHPRPG